MWVPPLLGNCKQLTFQWQASPGLVAPPSLNNIIKPTLHNRLPQPSLGMSSLGMSSLPNRYPPPKSLSLASGLICPASYWTPSCLPTSSHPQTTSYPIFAIGNDPAVNPVFQPQPWEPSQTASPGSSPIVYNSLHVTLNTCSCHCRTPCVSHTMRFTGCVSISPPCVPRA